MFKARAENFDGLRPLIAVLGATEWVYYGLINRVALRKMGGFLGMDTQLFYHKYGEEKKGQ